MLSLFSGQGGFPAQVFMGFPKLRSMRQVLIPCSPVSVSNVRVGVGVPVGGIQRKKGQKRLKGQQVKGNSNFPFLCLFRLFGPWCPLSLSNRPRARPRPRARWKREGVRGNGNLPAMSLLPNHVGRAVIGFITHRFQDKYIV